MNLPANIRVNVRVPFPALVTGSGIITVTKLNGRYTIGASAAQLVSQNPPVNLVADQVFVWDPVAKTFILTPLSGLIIITTRLQRSITGAGNLPIVAGDSILNINAVTDLAPVVPLASTRAGAELTLVNLPTSIPQTITASGGDLFGVPGGAQANFQLQPGTSVSLLPFNDGVNAGYSLV